MAGESGLTHLDDAGKARMVDVGEKPVTARRAVAEGEIIFAPGIAQLVRTGQTAKGDLFIVAQIAGIMAAKRTGELIPLCHPLALSHIDVRFVIPQGENKVLVRAEASTSAQTGVEMEALTAVSLALLTLYDMLKAADKTLRIGNVRLVKKEGGKSGVFVNEAAPASEVW